MKDPTGNGQRKGKPIFIGADAPDKRRAAVALLLVTDASEGHTARSLARRFGVSLTTMRGDLASDCVMKALDEAVERNIEGITLKRAWGNITRAIMNGDVDRSIWLIGHLSETKQADKAFEIYQIQLAKEFARLGQGSDPNEEVEVDIVKPIVMN